MKRLIFTYTFILLILALIFALFRERNQLINPVGESLPRIIEKPLEKYTYENLKKKEFKASEILLGKELKTEKEYKSYMFYFNVEDKKVSGLINIPVVKTSDEKSESESFPVVVMFRGYVDQKLYTIGDGTRRSGEFFASNPPAGGGFITLAPDFLGYGESDKPSSNSIEERFQTYTTVLTLLASVENLNLALEKNNINARADTEKIGIWGHSNGGQIALSVLELSGKAYPTVLWAPVSKPFPYSVLYFTDEFDDNGKALRRVISEFEKHYDIEKYSLTNFLDWINAPIQLHQGANDEAVPQKWSDQFVGKMKDMKKEITYFTYPGENHNFNNGYWNTVITRSVSFYNQQFAK